MSHAGYIREGTSARVDFLRRKPGGKGGGGGGERNASERWSRDANCL